MIADDELELAYLEELDFQEKSRQSILDFTCYTKKDYLINWHHAILAHYLDLFWQKKIKKLMVFMPPQYGKSELTSRRLPAFILGKYPKDNIIFGTYGSDLASRMNRDVQRIIDSDEYRGIFPETRLNSKNIRTVSGDELRNSEIFEIVGHRGTYRSAGRGQGITGMPCNWLLIDDLLKDRKEADSPTIRESAWSWLTDAALSRLWKDGSILYTTTRWHEDEPAGRLLERAKKNKNISPWTVIRFPAIKEDNDDPLDPREIGEPLWPWKQNLQALLETKANTTIESWNSLYQQNPSIKGGGLIKRKWWQRVDVLPDPKNLDDMIIVADPSMTDSRASDNCAYQCWGKQGSNTFLYESMARQMDFTESLEEFKAFCARWPRAGAKLVESKANGPAIVASCKDEISGVIAFNPDKFGSKESRLKACSPHVRAGNAHVLNEDSDEETKEFLDEITKFPKGAKDDRVDCFSMAHLYWFHESAGEFTDEHVPETNTMATLSSEDW